MLGQQKVGRFVRNRGLDMGDAGSNKHQKAGRNREVRVRIIVNNGVTETIGFSVVGEENIIKENT